MYNEYCNMIYNRNNIEKVTFAYKSNNLQEKCSSIITINDKIKCLTLFDLSSVIFFYQSKTYFKYIYETNIQIKKILLLTYYNYQ